MLEPMHSLVTNCSVVDACVQVRAESPMEHSAQGKRSDTLGFPMLEQLRPERAKALQCALDFYLTAIIFCTDFVNDVTHRFSICPIQRHKIVMTLGYCGVSSFVSYALRVSGRSHNSQTKKHHILLTSSPTQIGLVQKRCNGLAEALHPSKEVCNLYPNICSLPVSLLVNECVCFHCHLTLFVRNKLIYRCFKSVG